MLENILHCKDISFHNMRLVEAGEKIRSLSTGDKLNHVVTPNIDHLCKIYGSENNKQALPTIKAAALSLCNSRILEKMLRMKGKKLKEVVPGSTLTAYLFDKVLTPSDRILIFGVENEHFEILKQRYPHLTIDHINPSMGFIKKPDEVNDLIKQVEALDPSYIFLSVGAFQQEIFANKLAQTSKVKAVGLCVGASVLFLTGAQKRAPVFVQKMHLEWALRMLTNPRRLVSIYFKNFLALPKIYKALQI
ncbi:MAG: N-acetylglucosaminyldiphosphoundecaprenol N-acetyl-beta-D-mannosaminyltransferase [Cellvibrionaceae bacterium]|jgi:N-acetylglucosaminyldiphosphoundecaprenol N-acetyl-beta-D-mannosaminyltransferase